MQKSSTTVYRVLRRSTADVGRNTPLHLRPYIIWILQHPRSCGLQQRTKVCDVVIGGIFLGRLDEDIFSVLCYQFIGRDIFLSINSISLSSYIIPSTWHCLDFSSASRTTKQSRVQIWNFELLSSFVACKSFVPSNKYG